jgi:hypothetical protein
MQLLFFSLIGLIFILFGLYSLVKGKMLSGHDTPHQGEMIIGIKARIMGILIIILGVTVVFLGAILPL